MELLWAQSCVWSHQKVDLPNSGSFLGEAKKVLASPGLWGKLGFLPGSFFLWKKNVLTPHKFYRSAINRGLRRLWTFSAKYYVTQRILFAGSKKRIRTLLGSIKPLKAPLRSEHAFRNVRFAFCVVNVLRTIDNQWSPRMNRWMSRNCWMIPSWGQTGQFTEEVERRFADAIKHLEVWSVSQESLKREV